MLGFMSSYVSVPVTSMIQLAATGRDGFEQVDPVELRVRISVSSGFEIDVARTTLTFSISRPDGTVQDEKLALELIERSTMRCSMVRTFASRRGPEVLVRGRAYTARNAASAPVLETAVILDDQRLSIAS